MNCRTTFSAGALLLIAATAYSEEESLATTQLEEVSLVGDSVPRDATIANFTFEDIDEMQVNDYEDLVRYLPGVSVSKGDDRWGGSGYNIRGLDEDRVAINVDGVSQGESLQYDGGQAYGYFKGSRNGVDTDTLKSIEIVKGADSVLSGGGALAGAVNYVTKDPSDYLAMTDRDYFLGFRTSYNGANDELSGTFSFANLMGDFDSMVVYTRRKGHEYESYNMNALDVEGAAREIPDPQESASDSILVKLNYLAGENQSVGLVYQSYEDNSITDAQSYNGGWYANRIGDDTSETNRIGLSYRLESSGGFFDVMEASLNRQSVDFEAKTLQYTRIQFGPRVVVDEDRTDVRAFNQDLTQLRVDFSKKIDSGEMRHNLIYGLRYQDKEYENVEYRVRNSNLNDNGVETIGRKALVPTSDAKILALYGFDSIQFGENTTFRIGSRFTDITYDANSSDNFEDDTETLDETSFSSVVGTIGIDQKLNENLSASIGFSTAFAPPTIEQMYRTSGSLDDWGTLANPGLGAETTTNLDLSIDGSYSLGSFSLGYFNSKHKDFVELVDMEGVNSNIDPAGTFDPNGYRVPMNIGEVDIDGIEFSGLLDLDEILGLENGDYRATIAAAYTDGEQKNGDPLYSIQPFSATAGFGYTAEGGNWGSNLFTTFTKGKSRSADELDPSNASDLVFINAKNAFDNDYLTVDLTFFYNFSENVRATAGIYNLTDISYYIWDNVRFVDSSDVRPGIGIDRSGYKRYSEPGRNVRFSLSYSF